MARRDITGAVDFAHLEQYVAGDTALMEEVLVLFREQADVWRPMLQGGFEGWRDAARGLAEAGVPASAISWQVAGAGDLFGACQLRGS